MNRELKMALERGRILPFADGPKLISKELRAAGDDLAEARDRFAQGRFKYATITAYYAMFHAARALLYRQKYREKSHRFLLVALEAFYVESGKMTPDLARGFRNAMILREEADYHGDFSEVGAQSAVTMAERFCVVAKELLKQ